MEFHFTKSIVLDETMSPEWSFDRKLLENCHPKNHQLGPSEIYGFLHEVQIGPTNIAKSPSVQNVGFP